MSEMKDWTFSRWPASQARSRATISSAVRPRVAPTSTVVFASPPGRDAGVRTTARGPFERSSDSLLPPRRSKLRRAPETRFSTEAFANGPPESSTEKAPTGSSGRSRIGVNFFASKNRSTAKEFPSGRVAFVSVGSRETSGDQITPSRSRERQSPSESGLAGFARSPSSVTPAPLEGTDASPRSKSPTALPEPTRRRASHSVTTSSSRIEPRSGLRTKAST